MSYRNKANKPRWRNAAKQSKRRMAALSSAARPEVIRTCWRRANKVSQDAGRMYLRGMGTGLRYYLLLNGFDNDALRQALIYLVDFTTEGAEKYEDLTQYLTEIDARFP